MNLSRQLHRPYRAGRTAAAVVASPSTGSPACERQRPCSRPWTHGSFPALGNGAPSRQ